MIHRRANPDRVFECHRWLRREWGTVDLYRVLPSKEHPFAAAVYSVALRLKGERCWVGIGWIARCVKGSKAPWAGLRQDRSCIGLAYSIGDTGIGVALDYLRQRAALAELQRQAASRPAPKPVRERPRRIRRALGPVAASDSEIV